MISKAQVIERMHSGGKLEITTRYDNVELFGVAVCDTVHGSEGREKLRAKFGHGIKAVLEMRDYGKLWDAEEAPQEEAEATEAAEESAAEMLEGKAETETAEAADCLPWYGDTPEEQETQRQEAERRRRESKRAYDRERYRRRKAEQTPEAAEIEKNNKRKYDAARYLARKQRAAAAPPPPPEAAAQIGAEG